MTKFFSDILHENGLEGLYEMAKTHSLLGYVWDEISPEITPDSELFQNNRELVKRWFTIVAKIEEKNKQLNVLSEKVLTHFQSLNLSVRLLKGQSLAPLHDNPLHRSTGDIDVWVAPPLPARKNMSLSKRRNAVVEVLKAQCPRAKICYHHMDFYTISHTMVEAHFTPSWMANPFKNKKLQRYFMEEFDNENSDLNIIFILLHIFRHFFQEGITMKQVLDYYWVMKKQRCSVETLAMIKELGLDRFMRGLLWVEREVFGLEDKYIILPADEKQGQFILQTILEDKKNKRTIEDFTSANHLHNFGSRILRMSKLVSRYPNEALWELPWRIGHFVWRKWKKFV